VSRPYHTLAVNKSIVSCGHPYNTCTYPEHQHWCNAIVCNDFRKDEPCKSADSRWNGWSTWTWFHSRDGFNYTRNIYDKGSQRTKKWQGILNSTSPVLLHALDACSCMYEGVVTSLTNMFYFWPPLSSQRSPWIRPIERVICWRCLSQGSYSA